MGRSYPIPDDWQGHIVVHPVLALILSGGLLAACVGGAGFGGSRATPVLQGALKMASPPGYCVDQAASHEADDAAIVLMGRCSTDTEVAPAIITLSVGRGGSAGVMAAGGEGLAQFFTSDEGRATLSRSGEAADVQVIEALSSENAFLMRLQENDAGEYWRGVAGMRGRLVTVSVAGPTDAPLTTEQGRQLMDQVLATLRRVNKG